MAAKRASAAAAARYQVIALCQHRISRLRQRRWRKIKIISRCTRVSRCIWNSGLPPYLVTGRAARSGAALLRHIASFALCYRVHIASFLFYRVAALRLLAHAAQTCVFGIYHIASLSPAFSSSLSSPAATARMAMAAATNRHQRHE